MAEEQQLPSNIGRYEVKRLLGAGAMGSVYLAEDPKIKRRIAIKMVKADLLSSDMDHQEVLARFQREAEVSGLLNHPGIVAIFDFGESEGGPFLAMEFVEGRPMDEILKSGEQLSLTERFRILLGIGEALDHAHSKGITHRDIKPGNIMIALDGRPKLMDFGIAKREDASLTQTGTFLGTPSYASPEQIREGIVDSRSDIFSFGVMAFEFFVGKTPFPGSSINTILYKIVNEPPAMPDPPLEGTFPEAWKRIFEKVLAKRPQDRFGSCTEFLNELAKAFTALDPNLKAKLEHRASGTMPLLSPEPPPISTLQSEPKPVIPPPGKGFPMFGWVTIGLGAVGVAGYLWLNRTPKTSPNPPSGIATAPPLVSPVVETKPPEPKPAEPAPVQVPPPPAEPEPAHLKVSGTFAVRIKLEGRDLGECQPGKAYVIPVGTHQIDLSSPKVFYREVRRITVTPGKTIPLILPELATVTVSTTPEWGKVTIDGQATEVESVGETSITLTHGTHLFGIQGKSVKFSFSVQGDGQVKFKVH